jgi:hypothetical protein
LGRPGRLDDAVAREMVVTMTTTGRIVTVNEDAHHHEPNEAPLVHTDPAVSAYDREAAAIALLERWAEMASGAVWKNIFNGMTLDATTVAADTRNFLSMIK